MNCFIKTTIKKMTILVYLKIYYSFVVPRCPHTRLEVILEQRASIGGVYKTKILFMNKYLFNIFYFYAFSETILK